MGSIKAARAIARLQGYCHRCLNRSAIPPMGKAMCETCKVKCDIKRYTRKLAGLCANCAAPATSGKCWCSTCTDLHKIKRQDPKYRSIKREAKYKLETGEIQKLLDSQRNLCAICKSPFNEYYCIDHCHKTGRVRGLLCRKCNIALGMLADSIEILQAAIRYLN